MLGTLALQTLTFAKISPQTSLLLPQFLETICQIQSLEIICETQFLQIICQIQFLQINQSQIFQISRCHIFEFDQFQFNNNYINIKLDFWTNRTLICRSLIRIDLLAISNYNSNYFSPYVFRKTWTGDQNKLFASDFFEKF